MTKEQFEEICYLVEDISNIAGCLEYEDIDGHHERLSELLNVATSIERQLLVTNKLLCDLFSRLDKTLPQPDNIPD